MRLCLLISFFVVVTLVSVIPATALHDIHNYELVARFCLNHHLPPFSMECNSILIKTIQKTFRIITVEKFNYLNKGKYAIKKAVKHLTFFNKRIFV